MVQTRARCAQLDEILRIYREELARHSAFLAMTKEVFYEEVERQQKQKE